MRRRRARLGSGSTRPGPVSRPSLRNRARRGPREERFAHRTVLVFLVIAALSVAFVLAFAATERRGFRQNVVDPELLEAENGPRSVFSPPRHVEQETIPNRVPAPRFSCTVAYVIDGDTLACEETEQSGRQIRVRLAGIAARESDGTCARGHPCPVASAALATSALQRLASGQRLSCESTGQTYGRIAAFCRRKDDVDLSCAMLASGTVEVWRRYWGNHACS